MRKLKMLDVVREGTEGERRQGRRRLRRQRAILTGELSELIPDLLEALGGEMGHERREFAATDAGFDAPAGPGRAWTRHAGHRNRSVGPWRQLRVGPAALLRSVFFLRFEARQ
jgi:hypothetical protein